MGVLRRTIGKAYRTGRDQYYSLRFLNLNRKLQSSQNFSNLPPYQLFSDVNGWYWFWLNTKGYRKSKELQRILPQLPDAYNQFRFTGSSGDSTLREAFYVYSLVKQV